jgi:putative endopeptidase
MNSYLTTRFTAAVAFASTLAIAPVLAQSGQSPASQQSQSGIELASMDRTADPCGNFYQFACGGWIKAHPLPPDRPSFGRFDELQDRNDDALHAILEDAMKPGVADPDVKKIGDYYATCLAEDSIEAKGLAPVKPDLDRVAAMKEKTDVPLVVGHMHTVGISTFFGFGAAPDFKDSTHYMLIFDQDGMALPDRDYYLQDDEHMKSLRAAYEQHVAKIMTMAGDAPDQAAAEAKTVLTIESALAKASLDRTVQRDPANIYHKMTRDEVKKLMPDFNMSAYLERAEAPPGDFANVAQPEFLKEVDQIVATHSLADLKTYMRWSILHSSVTWLPKKFDDENFAFFGRMLSGQEQQLPRWKRCVHRTDSQLGEALGRIYVEKMFGTEGKQRTLQMVHDIEAALSTDIKQIDWMSDATKKQAEVKLQAVANKIGYPDKWRDYSSLRVVRGDGFGNWERANTFEYRRQLAKIGKPVDKTEWGMTPPTVNAYYNPNENNINFPAGILQPPFFTKTADDAVIYGAVAAVVGHELTHGFDDEGRKFDGDGNMREWWTPADGKAFEERAACVDKQYSSYTAVDDMKLNGKLTLGENVADNGGLRLAWMALMQRLNTGQLGQADGFTPQQRFFIGWGQMWCENRSAEFSRMLVKVDEHSPGQFRANGVVSNMPEFQKAFSCPATAPMVSQPVCRVW